MAYFVYLAVMGLFQPLPVTHRLALLACPVALCALWLLEASASTRGSRVTREWLSLSLILAGYWSLGWFPAAPREQWQIAWAGWDRVLLDGLGLRQAVEAFGALVPTILESVYFLVYAIPVVSLGVLYHGGQSARARPYLLVLFLGTFAAYSLLPLFPVRSPRVVFPETGGPSFHGIPRSINTWLLDRLDTAPSVFPSGHVAVAFSSAFGLLTVLRERRGIWMGAFLAASLVYIATVYGRYHYAVDGLASIGITLVAWRISNWWSPDGN